MSPIIDKSYRLEKDIVWQYTGLILFLFTFTYRVVIDKYDILFWSGICFAIAVTGLIMGLKREMKRKNNL